MRLSPWVVGGVFRRRVAHPDCEVCHLYVEGVRQVVYSTWGRVQRGQLILNEVKGRAISNTYTRYADGSRTSLDNDTCARASTCS